MILLGRKCRECHSDIKLSNNFVTLNLSSPHLNIFFLLCLNSINIDISLLKTIFDDIEYQSLSMLQSSIWSRLFWAVRCSSSQSSAFIAWYARCSIHFSLIVSSSVFFIPRCTTCSAFEESWNVNLKLLPSFNYQRLPHRKIDLTPLTLSHPTPIRPLPPSLPTPIPPLQQPPNIYHSTRSTHSSLTASDLAEFPTWLLPRFRSAGSLNLNILSCIYQDLGELRYVLIYKEMYEMGGKEGRDAGRTYVFSLWLRGFRVGF